MREFLLSLPKGKDPADFTSVEYEHPKGKLVTFLCSSEQILELHYHSPRIGDYSSFVTEDDETTIQSYGLLKATPFDVRLILLAQLEKLKDEEKAAVISEMKLPKKIKKVALSITCEKLGEMFNVADKGTKKIQFDQKMLFESLDKRLEKVQATILKQKIMNDSNKDKLKRYSARVICDCLPKETTKAYEMHLGIEQNVARIEAKENEPPIKRLKLEDGPIEDYTKGPPLKANFSDVKLTKKEADLKKASVGTKSIMSFFTPKKKS